MKITSDFEAAKLLLKRSPLELEKATPEVSRRLKQIFGKKIDPVQAVAQIISRCATKGIRR